jgi:hypothetical protein
MARVTNWVAIQGSSPVLQGSCRAAAGQLQGSCRAAAGQLQGSYRITKERGEGKRCISTGVHGVPKVSLWPTTLHLLGDYP